MEVSGHITLEITCDVGVNSKAIKVNYLIVDAISPYNLIPGKSSNNLLGAIISIKYLVLKYLLPIGRVGMVRENREGV